MSDVALTKTDRVYLTPNEVADRLHVSVEYLYRHLLGQPDGIPAMKIGRGPRSRWRVKCVDLEMWEAQQRVCYDAPDLKGDR